VLCLLRHRCCFCDKSLIFNFFSLSPAFFYSTLFSISLALTRSLLTPQTLQHTATHCNAPPQINAHESKISDLQEKLHSIDREQASESLHQPPPNTTTILNDSGAHSSKLAHTHTHAYEREAVGEAGEETMDRVQAGGLYFNALRSSNFGEARDIRGEVVRAIPLLAVCSFLPTFSPLFFFVFEHTKLGKPVTFLAKSCTLCPF